MRLMIPPFSTTPSAPTRTTVTRPMLYATADSEIVATGTPSRRRELTIPAPSVGDDVDDEEGDGGGGGGGDCT